MGLDIYLYDGKNNIEEKSDKHPEHYCNKGYLRSSYNSGGFNSVVGSMIGKDLYYIFDPIENEYNEENEDSSWYVEYPKEHLEEALKRAKEVIYEIKNAPPYIVQTVMATDLYGDKPTPIQNIDDYQALQIFNLVRNGEKVTFKYEILENEILCYAFIPGVTETNNPCVHVIYKGEDEIDYNCKTIPVCNKLDGLFKNKINVTKKQAIEIFKNHNEKDDSRIGESNHSYRTKEGTFYLREPLKVYGFIPGVGILRNPAIHTIIKLQKEYLEHYVNQAEIVEEFIEKALTLDEPRIGWSS